MSGKSSCGSAGGEATSAGWEQETSLVEEERPQDWGISFLSSPAGPLWLGNFAGWPQEGQARSVLCVADPRQRQRYPHLLCPDGGDCHSAFEFRVVGGEWEEGVEQACSRPKEM